MSTTIIYYTEINVICMIILSVMPILYSRETKRKAESLWYKSIIWLLIIYCITDIVAIIFKGMPGTGARIILLIAKRNGMNEAKKATGSSLASVPSAAVIQTRSSRKSSSPKPTRNGSSAKQISILH